MSPIERAVKALRGELSEYNTVFPDGGILIDGPTFDSELKEFVITVLKAIREPSDGMLIAGAQCRTAHHRFADPYSDETLLPEWQAMIDSALSEGECGLVHPLSREYGR